MPKKKCLICQNTKHQVVFEEFSIPILRCLSCGHIFSSYQGQPDYDGYFDSNLEDTFWWNEAHQRIYQDFCQQFIVGKKGRLLDVGCGLGFFIKKVSLYPNWQVEGYEISKEAAQFAQQKLKLKAIHQGKVESSSYPQNYFDIITLWDVVEHLADPQPMLSYLYSILKKDGLLFLHTPNIYTQLPKARIKKWLQGERLDLHYLEAKDHLNIYSPKSMTALLSTQGFKKIDFIHLHPIQSMAGSKNHLLKLIKNSWWYGTKIMDVLTLKKINLDNLFVVAQKG